MLHVQICIGICVKLSTFSRYFGWKNSKFCYCKISSLKFWGDVEIGLYLENKFEVVCFCFLCGQNPLEALLFALVGLFRIQTQCLNQVNVWNFFIECCKGWSRQRDIILNWKSGSVTFDFENEETLKLIRTLIWKANVDWRT